MSKIQVIARPDKFRRAGREFTRTPTIIAVADLKDGELQSLKDEPNLVVTDYTEPEPAEGGKGDGKGDSKGTKK